MTAALLLGFRWALGVVFVTTGAMKIRAAGSLEQTLASYGLVPEFLHRPVARSLPLLEVCLGTACILGVLSTLAGWVAFMLMVGFASGVGWNLARGRRFDCGCGTTHDTPISWRLVLRDLGLAAMAGAVALGPSGALAVWRGSSALPHHAPVISELIPIPMLVILILGVIRLLSTLPSVWRGQHRPPRPSDDSDVRLSIVQANRGAKRAAKVA
jgi:uncharacterized membrane protein YphA (DoxX/SURF4 family)